MDRNTFSGLFLILIILIGFTYFSQPSEQEIKREKFVQDSIAKAKSEPNSTPLTTVAKLNKDSVKVDSAALKGPFGLAHSGSDNAVVLENDKMIVTLSSKGGSVTSVQLKGFKTYDDKPLMMFNAGDSQFGMVFNAGNQVINTKDLYFTASAPSLKVAKNDSAGVSMRLSYSEDKYIDFVYSLRGDSYKVNFNIVTHGLNGVIPANQPLSLNWDAVLKQKEKDLNSEHRYSGAYFNHGDNDVDHIGSTKDEKKELGEDGKIKWVSFKQHFFSNVLMSPSGFDKANLAVTTSPDSGIVKIFSASLKLAAPKAVDNKYDLAFYFGPNQFNTLQEQGYRLERQIDLGWGPLKYINRVVVIPVFNFLKNFGWNYGLIILVLTVLLKLVLFPLTYKSYLSMAKMRVLKPEMDEIKTKVGEDNATLLQQEYLKLYKKAGVNPLGGCIPMVLQLPIVMAFFFFFPNLFELRGQSFLWMKDLSTYDSVITFATLPIIHVNHISLMCLLMTITTLISTYFNNQTSGAAGQMKYIGYITPIIFFGVLNSYPSGLNYYYFLANIMTFAQQILIRQWVNDDKIHAKIQENKSRPETPKKKSAFQQRMEEYMRQQQAKGKK